MPIIMTHATYSPAGMKGLTQDGGTKRKAAVKQMVEAAGGKLHAFYFAYGDSDVVIIAEYPDNATAASAAKRCSALSHERLACPGTRPPGENHVRSLCRV